jgi:hypothetical protein
MNPAQYAMNPFAPSYFQGVETPPGLSFDPRPFTYMYNPPNNELTSDQQIVGDTVSIDVDSDFLLMAWYISLFTGEFQIQLIDSSGYQLQSGYINSGALSQSSSNPTVFSPFHPFPAGGRIQINIQDLSGTTNPLQIAFVGEKLFRVAAKQGQRSR